MRYLDYKPFSVSSSGRSPEVCAKNGHAEPDRRGRCFMCGERIKDAFERMSDETVDARIERTFGIRTDESIAAGEVHVWQGGQRVAKIVNVAPTDEVP